MSRALGPAVRNLLERYGLSAKKITGSGPRGLLLKGDVLQHIQKENVKPVPSKKIPSQCLAKITTEFIYIFFFCLVVAVSKPIISPITSVGKQSVVPKVATTKKVQNLLHEQEYQDLELSSMRRTIAKRLTASKVSLNLNLRFI